MLRDVMGHRVNVSAPLYFAFVCSSRAGEGVLKKKIERKKTASCGFSLYQRQAGSEVQTAAQANGRIRKTEWKKRDRGSRLKLAAFRMTSPTNTEKPQTIFCLFWG